MALLNIQKVEEPGATGVTVVALVGEIDLDTVSQLRATLEDYDAGGICRLVLDMGKTSYVNSSALAVLVRFAESYKDKGGGIFLAGVSQRVKIPFEMLGLTPYFRFFDDVATAREAFASPASE